MFIELSESNKEYVEGLLAKLNKDYPEEKWTVDEIVNNILFKGYRHFLPFLLQIGWDYQFLFTTQEANYENRVK